MEPQKVPYLLCHCTRVSWDGKGPVCNSNGPAKFSSLDELPCPAIIGSHVEIRLMERLTAPAAAWPSPTCRSFTMKNC